MCDWMGACVTNIKVDNTSMCLIIYIMCDAWARRFNFVFNATACIITLLLFWNTHACVPKIAAARVQVKYNNTQTLKVDECTRDAGQ